MEIKMFKMLTTRFYFITFSFHSFIHFMLQFWIFFTLDSFANFPKTRKVFFCAMETLGKQSGVQGQPSAAPQVCVLLEEWMEFSLVGWLVVSEKPSQLPGSEDKDQV